MFVIQTLAICPGFVEQSSLISKTKIKYIKYYKNLKKKLLTADTANLDFYPEFSIQFRMCHPKNLTSEKTTTHELNHDLTFYFILTQSIVYLCQRSMFRVLWIYSFDQTVEN